MLLKARLSLAQDMERTMQDIFPCSVSALMIHPLEVKSLKLFNLARNGLSDHMITLGVVVGEPKTHCNFIQHRQMQTIRRDRCLD